MRTKEQLEERMRAYHDLEYVYLDNIGYIVWHYSTGDNIEILFLEATFGFGLHMYKRFIDALLQRNEKPYHTVFAFRLGSNEIAGRFYEKFGWTQVNLGRSIYRDDDTVMVWITWQDLLRRLGYE
jgi:hypothetical protein